MDVEQVRELLQKACCNGQAEWARQHQVSATFVSDVLRGQRPPGPTILAALGLEQIVTYRRRKA